jgi:hypothetical protein
VRRKDKLNFWFELSDQLNNIFVDRLVIKIILGLVNYDNIIVTLA